MNVEVRELMLGISALVHDNLGRILDGREEITWKPDGSPVTSADLLVERLVQEYVAARIPDLQFVSEESYGQQVPPAGAHYALLDPIDGTENFCSGLKEWGVAFSLWREKQHLGSMLMLPELGERLMTGDRIRTFRSRIQGFSSSMSDVILEQMRGADEARMFGCATYNLYNVIRGAFHQFSNPKGAYAWDLVPGLMLALEHKCQVTVDGEPFDGRFLEPNRKYRVHVQHGHDHHPGQGTLG
jgi:myo-inositol-1(or 4)-monophosphatase